MLDGLAGGQVPPAVVTEGATNRRPLCNYAICLPAGSTGCPLFAEAITTVNRAVASGLERDCGILATLCADHCMHLTRALAVSAIALAAARLTARITALGLVGETLLRMERLIVRAKGKRLSAVLARKGLILVTHR